MRPEVFTYALHAAERRQWKSIRGRARPAIRWRSTTTCGGDHTQLSPRLNLRYDVNDRLRAVRLDRPVHAGTARRRMARRRSAGDGRTQRRFPSTPSSASTYEPSTATRWGVEAYTKRWTTIAPYLDSQLDPLSLTPGSRSRIASASLPTSSEAAGLELSARTQFSDRLTGWGTLSWARVADDIADADIAAQLGPAAGADRGVSVAGIRASAFPRSADGIAAGRARRSSFAATR